MDKQSHVRQKIALPEHLCEADDPLSKAKAYTLELMLLADRFGGGDDNTLLELKNWIRSIEPTELKNALSASAKCHRVADSVLPCITSDLRKLIRKNECGYKKKDGEPQPLQNININTTTKTPLEVDSFLFEDLQDALEEQDLHSDRICHQCNSSNVQELSLNFSSYSIDALINLFGVILKDMTGKKMCIIGANEGAVAYGAFLFSNAENITLYEATPSSHELQKQVIVKHILKTRVKANYFNKLIEIPVEVITSADVITFGSTAMNKEIVSFLNTMRDCFLKGSLIIWGNTSAVDTKVVCLINSMYWLKRKENCLSSQIFDVYEVV